MAATNFTEVVASFTGNVTGNVTGDMTGNQTGGWILPTATVRSGADAANLIIDPGSYHVSLTKGSAGAYTLVVPGAANVGHVIVIEAGSAFAHVVTVTGLANGNTLTFTNVVGSSAVLYAVSDSAWSVLALGKAAQSQV